MDKTVVLDFRGDLEQRGFDATLQIIQPDGTLGATLDGQLPPSSKLADELEQWQQDYRQLATSTRALSPYKATIDGKIHPLDICAESARQLAKGFKRWLRADAFRDIDMHLRQVLTPSEAVQVLIRTANSEVQALPWHLWDFIEQYPKAEIALSGVRSYGSADKKQAASQLNKQVQVLAVLGDHHNIDVEHDRQVLNQLPGAQVEFLEEPSLPELHDRLYEQRWDILFFAGHSETELGGQGVIRLNADTRLTIPEVSYAVRRAIANGLQLAIFNSCNGLELARALAELQLPRMIVMREAVPDRVAQQFLKYFLTAFAEGRSLHLAAREARERLQGMEKDYPCASWLPVIYQQTVKESPTWSALNSPVRSSSDRAAPSATGAGFSRLAGVAVVAIVSIVVTSLIVGMRSLGLLQYSELQAFDRFMRWRPAVEGADPRLLIVSVGEEDIQYQQRQGMTMTGSLSDDALLLLLKQLASHQPAVVASDIIHDFPYSPELKTYLKSKENFLGICRIRVSGRLAGVSPPPQLSVSEIGFTNVPFDPDGVIRRQFLTMPNDEICQTDWSLSLQVAQRYIQSQLDRFDYRFTNAYSTQSARLSPDAGGYQLPELEASGQQILINYRASNPETISLRELLSGSLDGQLSELVRNRIILIGVIKPRVDRHLTPYSLDRGTDTMPGVVVQSHMISQILGAAIDNRPLLTWWPSWAEALWISIWSFLGSLVAFKLRSPWQACLATVLMLGALLGTCFAFFLFGWWIPLIPAGIGFIISGSAVIVYTRRQIGS